jgi:Asp-tRNA(Asn)/Glu-tRNA(Gln) amidotransferase C subunit
MAKAAGLEISISDLDAVAHHLNALLEVVEDIEAPGLEQVEPLAALPLPKEPV